MAIQVYNTLTDRKEPFEPVHPPNVGIYLCGPTVYKPSHIGHAVGPIIFDAIKRYLTFRGFNVTWVVNITDVEDKLIAEAEAQSVTVQQLAETVTQKYFDAMAALDVTGIDHLPKASEHIGEIIAMIQKLIENDVAYAVGGDVYFDVTRDDDYGKLSNRRVEDQTGQRELKGGGKRNPGDFALWKAAKESEPEAVKWDSPWGKGRPGWHIECSAMSAKLLGDTFDIHGGGMDLIFPHHENEIAQSESCTHKPFAKYWMHHGLTTFNTKKVSKSDPNMQAALDEMSLENLLQKHSGELLRFLILSTHYRSPIEFSPEERAARKKGHDSFHRLFERISQLSNRSVFEGEVDIHRDAAAFGELAATVSSARARFVAAMDDDFNTAAAIAVLFETAGALNRFVEQHKLETSPNDAGTGTVFDATRQLIGLGRLLGLFLKAPPKTQLGDDLLEQMLRLHVDVRTACRKKKRFELADLIRDRLGALGVGLEDRSSETKWHIDRKPNGELIDELMEVHLETRRQSRASKDFELADMIRDRLAKAGVVIEDKPTGTVWRVNGK